jgi:hypothetical protein
MALCSGNAFSVYMQPDLSDATGTLTVTDVDVQPHVLKAKASKNDADRPSYNQAINGPHTKKWWQAMETELNTLENDLRAWTLVKHEPWMNVLPMTWAFHLKHFPSCLVKKFKA